MNEVEKLRSYWLEVRGNEQQKLLENWTEASKPKAQLLANLHAIIMQALDNFQPQG